MASAHASGHGHGHGAAAAAPVAGEPFAFLSDPSRTSTLRCKRRWQDLELLKLDAMAPATTTGANKRFGEPTVVHRQIRERFLLFVKCIESKPGDEPKHPYLYPTADGKMKCAAAVALVLLSCSQFPSALADDALETSRNADVAAAAPAARGLEASAPGLVRPFVPSDDYAFVPVTILWDDTNTRASKVRMCRLDFARYHAAPSVTPMVEDLISEADCRSRSTTDTVAFDITLDALEADYRRRGCEAAAEAGELEPACSPSGLIAHESRCGSTLFSNMMASLPETLIYSELGPPNAVLRQANLTFPERVHWLRVVYAAMARPIALHAHRRRIAEASAIGPDMAAEEGTGAASKSGAKAKAAEGVAGASAAAAAGPAAVSVSAAVTEAEFIARGAADWSPRYLFLKTQHTTSLGADVYAAAFPAMPWVYLHRDPIEVMMSLLRDTNAAPPPDAPLTEHVNERHMPNLGNVPCMRTRAEGSEQHGYILPALAAAQAQMQTQALARAENEVAEAREPGASEAAAAGPAAARRLLEAFATADAVADAAAATGSSSLDSGAVARARSAASALVPLQVPAEDWCAADLSWVISAAVRAALRARQEVLARAAAVALARRESGLLMVETSKGSSSSSSSNGAAAGAEDAPAGAASAMPVPDAVTVARLLATTDVGDGASFASAMTALVPDCVTVRDGLVLDADLEAGTLLGVGVPAFIDYRAMPHVVPLLLDSHLRPMTADLRRQAGASCLSVLASVTVTAEATERAAARVKLVGAGAGTGPHSSGLSAFLAAAAASAASSAPSFTAADAHSDVDLTAAEVMAAMLLPDDASALAALPQAGSWAAAAAAAAAATATALATGGAAPSLATQQLLSQLPALELVQHTNSLHASSRGPFTPAWRSQPYVNTLLLAGATAVVAAADTKISTSSSNNRGSRSLSLAAHRSASGSGSGSGSSAASLTLASLSAAAFPPMLASAAEAAADAAADAAAGPGSLTGGSLRGRPNGAGLVPAPAAGAGLGGIWALRQYRDRGHELSLPSASVASMLLTSELYSKSRATIAQLAALATAPGGIRPFLRTGSGRLRAARAWTSINAQGRYVSDTDAKQAMAWAALRAAAAKFLYPLREVMVAFNVPITAEALAAMAESGAGDILPQDSAKAKAEDAGAGAGGEGAKKEGEGAGEGEGEDAAVSAAVSEPEATPSPQPTELPLVTDLREAALAAVQAVTGSAAAAATATAAQAPFKLPLPPLPTFVPALLPLDPDAQLQAQAQSSSDGKAGGASGAPRGPLPPGGRLYPQLYPLPHILAEWSPDIVTPPGIYGKYNSLRYFDWSDAEERALAERYRRAEVPFVIRNHAKLEETVNAWSSDAKLGELIGSDTHWADTSESAHFMFYHKAGAAQLRREQEKGHGEAAAASGLLYTPPTRSELMSFKQWLREAYKVADEVGAEEAEQLPAWWGALEEDSPADAATHLAALPLLLAASEDTAGAGMRLGDAFPPAAAAAAAASGAIAGGDGDGDSATAPLALPAGDMAARLAAPAAALPHALAALQLQMQRQAQPQKEGADADADSDASAAVAAALQERNAELLLQALRAMTDAAQRTAAAAAGAAAEDAGEGAGDGDGGSDGQHPEPEAILADKSTAAAAAAALPSLPSRLNRGGIRPRAKAPAAAKQSTKQSQSQAEMPSQPKSKGSTATGSKLRGGASAPAAGRSLLEASIGEAVDAGAGADADVTTQPWDASAAKQKKPLPASASADLLSAGRKAPADALETVPAAAAEESAGAAGGADAAAAKPFAAGASLLDVPRSVLEGVFTRAAPRPYPATVTLPAPGADAEGAVGGATLPLTAPPLSLLPYLTWPAGVVQSYGLPSRRPLVPPLSRARRTRHYLHLSNVAPAPTKSKGKSMSKSKSKKSSNGEDKAQVSAKQEYALADGDAAPWMSAALPFLDARNWPHNDSSFFLPEPSTHAGIHCRFGQPGTLAEAHYDSGRNFIAMARGYRRYILAPPDQCPYLGLMADGPSARHSALDWTAAHSLFSGGGALSGAGCAGSAIPGDPSSSATGSTKTNANANPLASIAGASALEVVLEPGDVLYVPPLWFHFIASLTVNVQCNARTGTPPVGDGFITACGMPQPPVSEPAGVHTDSAAVAAATEGGGGSGAVTPRLLPPLEYARISLGAEVDALLNKGEADAPDMAAAILSKPLPELVMTLRSGSKTLPRGRSGVASNTGLPDAAGGLRAVHPGLDSGLSAGGTSALGPLLAAATASVAGTTGNVSSLLSGAPIPRAPQVPLEILVPPQSRLPADSMVALLAALEADADARGDSPAAVPRALAPEGPDGAEGPDEPEGAEGPGDSGVPVDADAAEDAGKAKAKAADAKPSLETTPTPGETAAAAAAGAWGADVDGGGDGETGLPSPAADAAFVVPLAAMDDAERGVAGPEQVQLQSDAHKSLFSRSDRKTDAAAEAGAEDAEDAQARKGKAKYAKAKAKAAAADDANADADPAVILPDSLRQRKQGEEQEQEQEREYDAASAETSLAPARPQPGVGGANGNVGSGAGAGATAGGIDGISVGALQVAVGGAGLLGLLVLVRAVRTRCCGTSSASSRKRASGSGSSGAGNNSNSASTGSGSVNSGSGSSSSSGASHTSVGISVGGGASSSHAHATSSDDEAHGRGTGGRRGGSAAVAVAGRHIGDMRRDSGSGSDADISRARPGTGLAMGKGLGLSSDAAAGDSGSLFAGARPTRRGAGPGLGSALRLGLGSTPPPLPASSIDRGVTVPLPAAAAAALSGGSGVSGGVSGSGGADGWDDWGLGQDEESASPSSGGGVLSSASSAAAGAAAMPLPPTSSAAASAQLILKAKPLQAAVSLPASAAVPAAAAASNLAISDADGWGVAEVDPDVDLDVDVSHGASSVVGTGPQPAPHAPSTLALSPPSTAVSSPARPPKSVGAVRLSATSAASGPLASGTSDGWDDGLAWED